MNPFPFSIIISLCPPGALNTMHGIPKDNASNTTFGKPSTKDP